MTKREVLTYINENFVPTITDEETAASVADYVAKEFAALDKKAANAKVYAAKKRDELDEMAEGIMDIMTTELVPIDLIVEALGDPEATKAKVQARLSKLHKAGKLDKGTINVGAEGSKKRMVVAYSLPVVTE